MAAAVKGDGRRTRVGRRLSSWLSRRDLPLWLAGMAILLSAGVLDDGMALDDYVHYFHVVGLPPDIPGSSFDIFSFTPRDPAVREKLMREGGAPWFIAPHLHLAFWRPITSLTHSLDYRLWPGQVWWMHLENVLGYALLVLLLAKLYRKLLPVAWVAGVAALLYTIDDAHALAVGWIANRNALLAAIFAFLAFDRHLAWCREGGWRALLAALLFLAMGLLSAEAAIGVGAYLFAYALFLDSGRWFERARRLLPYFLLVVGWRLLYRHLGYGVVHSGAYIDPLRDPARFLHAFVDRAPRLLLGQFALPPADLSIFLRGGGSWAHWGIAAAFLAGFLWLVWPLLRRSRRARFWLLGLALATLPISATFPSDRLLYFVGFGAFGLIAEIFGEIAGRAPDGAGGDARERVGKVMRWFFVGIHLLLPPLLFPLRASFATDVNRIVERSNLGIAAGANLAQRRLVHLRAPNHFFPMYGWVMRRFHGRPLPRSAWSLVGTLGSVEVFREDARSLRITPARGFWSEPIDSLFRDEGYTLRPGETIRLDGLVIEAVDALPDRRPRTIRFRFDEPLEDPEYLFVVWEGNGYRPFPLPPLLFPLRASFATDVNRIVERSNLG
ncbi:MAG: hypothetical protein D6795_07275, partial [Deltaproteobacteria bacterium]